MLFARVRNYIQRIAKVSGNIIDNIPGKDDNLPTKVIKLISLVDAAQEFLYGKRDPVREYLSQYNLVRKSNEPFVRLFFSNVVRDNFDLTITSVSNDVSLLKVSIPEIGDLYFVEHKYETYTEKAEEFWHSPDFDFEAFMDKIWELYDGKIYVTLHSKDYRWRPSFSTFSVSQDPIYGSAKDLLATMRERDAQYRLDEVPRSYMFFGPPGSGKSSFAQMLGADSQKIIKFDSKSLDSINKENINFLLDGLMPHFIIIDDIDKVIYSASVATLLYILEAIKRDFPNTTVIVTANETGALDRALLRPGRIDEIFSFDAQNKKDRKLILLGYANSMGVKLKKKQVKEIIKKTDGLSAAYLREVIVQMKYSPMEYVLNSIETMKTILGINDEEETLEAEEPKKRKKKKNKKSKRRRKRAKGLYFKGGRKSKEA